MIKMVLISLLLMFFLTCRDIPTEPEEPYLFWEEIEVIYNRDPAKIRFPKGNDFGVCVGYELFDPERKLRSVHDKELIGNYRTGGRLMEKIGENKFRSWLEYVFAQSASWHGKHRVFISDPKLYDGSAHESTYTPYGIQVEKAYDIEIIGYEMVFRISRK